MANLEKSPVFYEPHVEQGLHVPSQFRLRTVHEVPEEDLQEISVLYSKTYGSVGLSIGERAYETLTLPTTTDIATISEGGLLLAVGNLNGSRLGMVASRNGKEHVRKGLVGELITGIQKEGVPVWMTISTDRRAHGMLAAVTTSGVDVFPVNDRDRILDLFSAQTTLSGSRDFIFTDVEHEFLTYRLKKKGIDQETFLAVSSVPSLHGPSYQQIVFQ